MAIVTITLSDTPTGGVAIESNFTPAVGRPCSVAQAAALYIINRTARDYGLPTPVERNRSKNFRGQKNSPAGSKS